MMDGRNTGGMDGEKDVRRDIRRREIEIDTDWRLAECISGWMNGCIDLM